ncbi:MAG: DUF2244 domain-containing protein [Rhizobiaceae bacterium]|nr:DUF2244 domain-containing protein [Rhizobiaceae bacterium]
MLTPYRSLSRNGFIVLMSIIGVSCFISGMLFLAIGAWPVMIALGIDVLVIWLAFKLNYRSARRYEEISLWRDEVRVRKVSPSGKATEFSFNPFWAKFMVDRHEEFGVLAMKLREAGRELELGSFLNPDDRKSFASAFSLALAKARK